VYDIYNFKILLSICNTLKVYNIVLRFDGRYVISHIYYKSVKYIVSVICKRCPVQIEINNGCTKLSFKLIKIRVVVLKTINHYCV